MGRKQLASRKLVVPQRRKRKRTKGTKTSKSRSENIKKKRKKRIELRAGELVPRISTFLHGVHSPNYAHSSSGRLLSRVQCRRQ